MERERERNVAPTLYFHEIEFRRIRKCLPFLGIQEVLVFFSSGSDTKNLSAVLAHHLAFKDKYFGIMIHNVREKETLFTTPESRLRWL